MAKKKIPEEHPIDQLFREGMEQRQFVYDEKYWAEAEKALAGFNRTANRKRIGWWLGGAATLLLVISVFLWQRSGDTLAPASEHTAMSGSEQAESTGSEITHAASTHDAASTDNTSVTKPQSISETDQTVAKSTVQPEPTPVAEVPSSSPKTTTPTQTRLPDNITAVTQTPTSDASSTTGQQPEKQVSTQPDVIPSDEKPATAVSVNVEDIQEVPNTDPMPDPAIAISSAITQGALPPRDLGQPRMQWYAGMYAGTQRTYPTFTGGPINWSSYIEDKERQAYSPTISLEAGMKIKRIPVDFNLGATFMQMGEDGLFAITNTLHDTTITIDIDSMLIIDSTFVDTGWVYSYDWMVTEDSIIMISSNDTTIIRKASNRLYYIEIPILFGYVWQYKNWNFRLSTGPSIGILHKRAGYYPNDNFTAFDALEDVDYFNKTVWYWKAEPAIGYSISPNVLLQCRGSFRVQLSDTYAADDRSLRYWTHGLQMGLRYTFTGK